MGDPHLHTHVIVPNRQARADGVLVSIDGTSLYHEARAAGVIYQATLRRELHQSMGLEWAPVDPSTGMAELAGIDRDSITAWSRRSSQFGEWAAHNLSGPTDVFVGRGYADPRCAVRTDVRLLAGTRWKSHVERAWLAGADRIRAPRQDWAEALGCAVAPVDADV